MKFLVGLTIATVLILLASLALYLGALKPVSLEAMDDGPYRLVFQNHVGAYHKIVPIIEKVEAWAKANGEPCKVSFGEYLDDPRVMEEGRLQSNGGCIVTGDFSGAADASGGAKKLPDGLQYREVPRRYILKAVFEGAPSIGPMKVYSKAEEWMKVNKYTLGGPVIELYEVLDSKSVRTTYLFPLGR